MDSYEELVGAGIECVEHLDTLRWKLGDLAEQVKTVYGGDTLGKYASDIGISRTTLYAYRQVSRFFPPEHRAIADNIKYSHYRAAMSAGSLAAALAYLDRAADEGLTAERVSKLIQADGEASGDAQEGEDGQAPRKRKFGGIARIINVQPELHRVVIEMVGEDIADLQRWLEEGRAIVRIAVEQEDVQEEEERDTAAALREAWTQAMTGKTQPVEALWKDTGESR
jgi:hypothetical protein